MESTVQDWGSALLASLTSAMALFFAAIPKIVGFLVILLIGWLIASLIAKAVSALLRAVNFNGMAERAGFADFVGSMGIKTDSAGFLAAIAKWFIRLIVLVVAFDALGLPAVSDVFRQFLLWIPNLVVAMVVLVIAGLAANALSSLILGATTKAGFSNSALLAKIGRVAVWAFGVVVAVNQLGIAETIVNTLFMAIVGAVALAAGLAFGLGAKDTAGDIVRSWRERGRAATPKLEKAAESMKEEAAMKHSPHMPGGRSA
jgi:hypothetical protein